MRVVLRYSLIVSFSIFIGVILSSLYSESKIDRTPPWHPFELNSNINLETLVKDGYRCYSIPCGQAQFIKYVGDTMIQYDASSIDCENYEGHYEKKEIEFIELDEEEMIPLTDTSYIFKEDTMSESEIISSDSLNYIESIQDWNQKHEQNPYFPYNIDEVKNCYQGIHYKVFQIYLEDIDSNWVLDYISRKGAVFVYDYQNWNSTDGGSFLVYHRNSRLYFDCSITKDEFHKWDDSRNWRFSITRSIPHLDQKRQQLEKLREEKINAYYRVE